MVRNSQVKSDKNLINHIWVDLATVFNLMSIKTISRFLVFIILDSYKLNIVKVLKHTFYSSYILVRKKNMIQR